MMRVISTSRDLIHRASRLIPSLGYVTLLGLVFWSGLPALVDDSSDGSLARSKLVEIKEAAERQAVVYLLHDLAVGRQVICRAYASRRDEYLDTTGQGLEPNDANSPIAAFARGLALWRHDFCAIPEDVVNQAIAAIRLHRAATVLDDQSLIDRSLWALVVDPRRAPAKSVEWDKAVAVNLDGATLSGVSLRGASLRFASLRGVQFVGAVLADADFLGADLAGVLYSPDGNGSSGSLPSIGGISGATNLETIRYIDPAPIYALRSAFREHGYRDAERKLTYVIERNVTEGVCSQSGGDQVQCVLRRLFMQWPTSYGLHPSRALQVIFVLVGGFSGLYLVALSRQSNPHVWRVWSKDRIARNSGSDTPEPVLWNQYAPLWAIYFSVVSASQIGWKDLTIGNWIARIQPGEYSLQATGWVRTASGVQAVTTVYLLAIWALTYFGRPFG